MNRNDQQFIAQKIRAQYVEPQTTELDALRTLDARVKRPANIAAYLFGSVSAIVMGFGMSLVMTDIGATLGMTSSMVPGILIGIVGLALAAVNYPLYQLHLSRRKQKYRAEILNYTDKFLQDSQ